jgi:prepilin-type N-terminal cleavage/methylation domain-containing protein
VRHPSKPQSGFTIIEVLVAIALFAIVVLVVLAPLTGLFGLTQKSARQTSATGLVQKTIETIRGQWLDANRYGNNCVSGALQHGHGDHAGRRRSG